MPYRLRQHQLCCVRCSDTVIGNGSCDQSTGPRRATVSLWSEEQAAPWWPRLWCLRHRHLCDSCGVWLWIWTSMEHLWLRGLGRVQGGGAWLSWSWNRTVTLSFMGGQLGVLFAGRSPVLVTIGYLSVRAGAVLCGETLGLCCADSASTAVVGAVEDLRGTGARALCRAGCRGMRWHAPFGWATWSPPDVFPSLGVFTKPMSSVILFVQLFSFLCSTALL